MTHLKVSCESQKSLAQEIRARKSVQVTCESSTQHTCKLNNDSCKLKVAFRGRYCVANLTGQSQLAVVCERKLSGIELVLFLKVDFCK